MEVRLRVHLEPTFGEHELRAIRPSTIQIWLAELQKKLAPTYVRVLLANLSGILLAAVDDGLIARKSGVEPTRINGMHALRHYYASALLESGVSIRAVSKYLGHADPGFTLRIYAHLMPPAMRRPGTRSTLL